MGMSIEENVATLKEHLNTLNVDKGVEFYQEIESIQSAIDIMRKYQKIEQIIDDWEHDVYPTSDDALEDIERILKNGKDNN